MAGTEQGSARDSRAGDAVDVLVVGAGPTGLTAAHLCAAVGLSCTVVERRPGPQRAPAAHAVNARSFEIWRQCGVAMAPLLAAAGDPAEVGDVHWVTKLGGEVLGSLPYERQGDEMLAVTPTPLRNLSQHRLEPLLAPPHGDLRYGHTWTAATQHDRTVGAEISDPDGGTYTITARYLLAADGAASPVRKWLGIEPVGPRTIQSFVMIHIGADFRPLVEPHPGVLHFVTHPGADGVFVAHDPGSEWVYMHPWDPDTEPVEDFTPERGAALVRAALADPDAPFEVIDIATWHMSAQVAPRYRGGRAFLVGDSAHRFPPTGGLGLNTGVADVHNLVWKLAAVEAGWADPALLDTYEQERRPVAEFNREQSLHNALKLVEVSMALGATDDPDESAAAMERVLADPAGRGAVEAAIADQATHFDLLGLQLGHRYEHGAVVPDGTPPDEVADAAREYRPSTRPGGRLPHAWLDDARSTLDLVDPAVPTVLHREGTEPPPVGRRSPTVTRACAPDLWADALDLDDDVALVVRPDQHVAFRGPGSGVEGALRALFGPPPG